MFIEFLEAGSQDCPLIRLYGVEPKPVSSLHKKISGLANGIGESCLIHELTGFRALSGCTFSLFTSSSDEAVRRIGQSLNFEWRLTADSWLTIAGLVEPFVTHPTEGTFQWLSGKESSGDIAILLSYSADGRW